MRQQQDRYLADEVYGQMLDRLLEITKEDSFHGTDARTEIVAALGEIGAVWPEGIRSGKAMLEEKPI